MTRPDCPTHRNVRTIALRYSQRYFLDNGRATLSGAVCDCEDTSDAVYAVISGLGSLRCVTPLIHFFQREPQRVGAAPGTKCSYLDDYPNKETIRAPGEFQSTLTDELLLTLPIYLNGQVI